MLFGIDQKARYNNVNIPRKERSKIITSGYSISKTNFFFNQSRHGGTNIPPNFKIALKSISHRFRVIKV